MTKSKEYEKNDLNSILSENRFVDWFTDNAKYIVWAILGLFICFALLFYFYTATQKRMENEYIAAEVEFLTFQKGVVSNKDATQVDEQFQKLNNVLNKIPELHAKYDGKIAQLLFLQNNPSAASTFANDTLKRVQSNQLVHYNMFAQTTQLIAENNYPQALIQSNKLRQAMVESQESTWEDGLYISNLIRIASLEQKLENPNGELQIWREIKLLAKSETPAAAKLRKILNDFSIGSVSLINYIDYREKSLSQTL